MENNKTLNQIIADSNKNFNIATKKALYKIFNTVTKKYLSFGYRNKATWNSPVWVEKAVFENIHESEYENIEIHIYPDRKSVV